MKQRINKLLSKIKTFLAIIPGGVKEIRKLPGFLKTKAGKICMLVTAVVLVALLVFGGYSLWLYEQAKFRDVTIELGEALPKIEAFLTEHAAPDKAVLVTPAEEIDLTAVGSQKLTFRYGRKEETVTLTIQDTTAPKVQFRDLDVNIRDGAAAEDFVVSVEELSDYTVTFAEEWTIPETFDDASLEILVTDAHGNVTRGTCQVRYQWLRESYTMELGDTLKKIHLLHLYSRSAGLLDQAQIDAVNSAPAGTYTITGTSGSKVSQCVVTVQDTVAPVVTVQDVVVFFGETAVLEDFVLSAEDISGPVVTRLKEPLPLDKAGVYTIVVEAEDINGNVAEAEAQLRVIVDTKPPEFHGVDTLYVEKYSNPSYRYGVTAVDARDGEVAFTVDTSRVNVKRAGTYYAVYTATDNEGNVATYRRQVEVSHDHEDTAELVASIAAYLEDDVEDIRDHVRDHIWYSSNWGGNDPIWFGFKSQNGNCYVHALCFQALLQSKGYESQLIWAKDKSHYWNMVKIDGVWKHMDSTPGSLHQRYSIMNDAQRYETLSGRDWDRTAWPVVE